MNRRDFVKNATVFGTGMITIPAINFKKYNYTKVNYMRLDSHIHILSKGRRLDDLEKYLQNEGITHAVTIFRTDDLGLIQQVKNIGQGIIPFHRPSNPLEPFVDLRLDSPILGYKIHLRHPIVINKAGKPVSIDDEGLYPMCSKAEKVGRPFLFHTDADEPKLCTLPQLANLAERYKLTNFIAAHTGTYTQEYQSDPMKPEEWESIAPVILKENIEILLDVKNLYADTALLGRDYPERSFDPEFKLKLLKAEVGKMSLAKRRALLKKLFIGTDFPGFYDEKDKPRIGYHFQKACMEQVFGNDFDETKMTKNFLNLLPKREFLQKM
jgi:hypothetical protein